jgi:hypothetical protein
MTSPDDENVLQLCTVATPLAQSLERELVHTQDGKVRPGVKEVYDAVYLPRG